MTPATDRRLSRDRRLRRKAEIDRVFRRGRSGSDALLRVHAISNGLPESRLGISCPRKVGSSVARNRWKRLIREAFRLNREALGPGLDVVVVPLRPPGSFKRQDVERSLTAIVGRIRRRGP
jgi:ribonuclease P protein component